MKRLAAFFRRCRALARIRDTERQLQGVIDLQRTDIDDESIKLALSFQRRNLSRRLSHLRASYVAEYMAPGERLTYEVA